MSDKKLKNPKPLIYQDCQFDKYNPEREKNNAGCLHPECKDFVRTDFSTHGMPPLMSNCVGLNKPIPGLETDPTLEILNKIHDIVRDAFVRPKVNDDLALAHAIDEARSVLAERIDEAVGVLKRGLKYHEHDGHDMPKKVARDALIALGIPKNEQP